VAADSGFLVARNILRPQYLSPLTARLHTSPCVGERAQDHWRESFGLSSASQWDGTGSNSSETRPGYSDNDFFIAGNQCDRMLSGKRSNWSRNKPIVALLRTQF
jgi:hypothetical protein